jgi:N-acetylglucosaminyldiphosphoundecaprenol N-acetyl-beta-D-mannosaminyltransferase
MRKSEPVDIFNIRFQIFNRDQVLEIIKNGIENDKKTLVLSGNIHSFNLSYENDWLRELFNRADVVRIDGAGLRLGARLLGYELPERMTWADFAWDLAKFCSEQDFSIYFLGGSSGIARIAALKLQEQYSSLKVVGVFHGYFNKSPGHFENEAVIQNINSVNPDVLIVGFGMPLQEKWLNENWEKIQAKVVLTGGAVFEYISGELQRAPRWMTDNDLEWLGRLLIEPKRLWRRYLIGNPLFFWRVLKQRVGWLGTDKPTI